MLFKNRKDAGKLLAAKLTEYKNSNAIVYGLPRGGVIVAYEIAKELNLPLDVLIARKIGHPYNPEYALCAISDAGELVCGNFTSESIDEKWFSEEKEKSLKKAVEYRNIFARYKQFCRNRIIIIADDGIATGLTMLTAIKTIKKENPKKIVIAVPVAPEETAELIEKEVDQLVALERSEYFLGAVGSYYENFTQVTDEEVKDLLEKQNMKVKNEKRYKD